MKKPEIVRIIESSGEVDDLIDYLANNLVVKECGMGFTACSPSLEEITTEGSEKVQSIKFGLDHTFVNENGQVMGYGIVGHMYISIADNPNEIEILYITPKEELDQKINFIHQNNIEATPRPRGKY